MLLTLLSNIWQVLLDTAFWLLFGLLAAGMIKTLIPESAMKRWVGGNGIASILRAALFGAPLPLCSCGVLPAAIGLHRAGASKEATVSFLISTPETSIDSVAVTYALMGPVMAIYRPISALVSAIVTGIMTTLLPSENAHTNKNVEIKSCCNSQAIQETGTASCCEETAAIKNTDSCCSSEKPKETSCCSTPSNGDAKHTGQLLQIIQFAGTELLDDIAKWMTFGIIFSGIMLTFIPPDWLAQWGQGFTAMLIMLVVGIPMYICAVASTPVAASLLIAGVSPGAVLIFLLVGPATNIASFALLKQELGMRVTLVYLVGIASTSLIMGLLLEWLLANQGWGINARIGHEHAMLPTYISIPSAALLSLLAIKPARRIFLPFLDRR